MVSSETSDDSFWGGALVLAAMLVAALLAGPREARAIQVDGGGEHTCAVVAGGGVKCWGDNFYGQLGDGCTYVPGDARGITSPANRDDRGVDACADQNTPVDVSGLGSGVVATSAGAYHTCAVTAGGGVKCWGLNEHGELGVGSASSIPDSTPVDVNGLGSGALAVSAGSSHTCAVVVGGGVKCWGDNFSGQLGDGTGTAQSAPVQVSGLESGVLAMSAGQNHTCAVAAGGGVKCWGSNSSGQLGDASGSNQPAPVDVNGLGSGVVAVSASGSHTCAVVAGGGVKCWGIGFRGRLGDGTGSNQPAPVDVSGLGSGALAVSAGANHTCAVAAGGGVKCWGSNLNGQVGDGTNTHRMTPVDVLLPAAICGDGVVDAGEGCDGGGCCANDCVLIANGIECRAAPGQCDVAENCDGLSALCPDDQVAVHGTSCSAEEPCTSGACQAGECGAVVAPRDDCREVLEPWAAMLKLKDSANDAKDQLGWDWKVGAGTTLADLGGPDQLGGASYELCVYGESGPEPEVLLSATVAPGPGWLPVKSKGYKFSDKAGTQGGITQILTTAGEDGRASVKVKGKGVGLALPVLPLGLPVRVQLEVAGGVCFEAAYSPAGASKNGAGQFQGLSD